MTDVLIHGGNGGYQAGCREACCRSAHARAHTARRNTVAADGPRRLDPKPIIAAVRYAIAAGIPWSAIRRKACPNRSLTDLQRVQFVNRPTYDALIAAIGNELDLQAERLRDARASIEYASDRRSRRPPATLDKQ